MLLTDVIDALIFKQLSLEKSSDEFISFQTFEIVNYCPEHLSLPTGATIGYICSAREDGEKKGTVKSKHQLVHISHYHFSNSSNNTISKI